MDAIDEIFGAAKAEAVVAKDAGSGVEAAGAGIVSESSAPGEAAGLPNGGGQTTPMSSLASWVMSRFQENENFRRLTGVTDKLDYCIRSQKCEFTGQQMEKLSAKLGGEVAKKLFVPITAVKIRAARAMLIDLANQSGEPLFRIEPTPKPDVPTEFAQKAATDMAAGITKFFAAMAQSGVQELTPEQMATLQEYVAKASSARYDEVCGEEENFARIRADRMQKKVWDLMVEGGWNEAFADYLDYICTYGTGVIIGPTMKNVAKNECVKSKDGVPKYSRTVKKIPTFEAVNPCDCYPAPDAKGVDDGPLCIRVKYTADELARFGKGAKSGEGDGGGEGWIWPQVNLLVARHPRGGVRLNIGTYSTDRRWCENNGFEDVADCTFEGVRCFSTVRGSELLALGITKTRERDAKKRTVERDEYYRTETVVIDNRVVYCRIYAAAEDLPVSKGVFYTLPGSWWGESIADKVAMCQCILNNCIASLAANMPASSGSIIWVNDVQRLANKTPTALKIKAGMVIPFTSSMMGGQGAPIGSLNVPSNASELLAVFQKMQTQADLDSGLPAYTEGQSAGQSGALRTASGLAIFTEASTRGLKMVMTTTDKQVISRVARLTADWVLLNDADMDLKGDVEVMPVGLIGKILKAQRDQQRMQLFQIALNSPLLQQIIGINGVVEMFRPSLSDLDINANDVLPSKSRMAEMQLMESIKQLNALTQGAAPQGEEWAQGEAQGDVPQGTMEQPEAPQIEREPRPGSVAERRGVA